MGMYYAGMDGEGDEVANAIEEQYLPAFSGDMVPETDAGTGCPSCPGRRSRREPV